MQKVIFEHAPQDGFYKILVEKIDVYFKTNNISRKANWIFALKIISYFIIDVSIYLLIISGRVEGINLVFLFVIFGIFNSILIFSVAHDASHNAISNVHWVNQVFTYVWNTAGVSNYFWALKHNIAHHSFTNIPGKDDDIDQSKLVRLNPKSSRRWFHRYQHIYAPFLYSLLSINIIYVKDFKLLVQHNFGNKLIGKHPSREIWILLVTKVIYIGYMILLPKYMLGISWLEIIGFHLVMHLATGLYIGFILVPVHVTGESEYRLPDAAGKVHSDWGKHQVEATVDFAAGSYFINWITGGLNTHVVHHLFPTVNHIHYFQLTKIVKQVALENNFPYRNYSLIKIFKEHLHFLKLLGRVNNPTQNAQFDVKEEAIASVV